MPLDQEDTGTIKPPKEVCICLVTDRDLPNNVSFHLHTSLHNFVHSPKIAIYTSNLLNNDQTQGDKMLFNRRNCLRNLESLQS